MAVPKGLSKCTECGEYRGEVKSVRLNWTETQIPPPDAFEPIRVRCLCEGRLCSGCGKTRMHRPVSNHYDEATNTIGHFPWLYGYVKCAECKEREAPSPEELEAERKDAEARLEAKRNEEVDLEAEYEKQAPGVAVYAIGCDDALKIIDRKNALRTCRIRDALRAGTWGQVESLVDPGTYQELVEAVGEAIEEWSIDERAEEMEMTRSEYLDEEYRVTYPPEKYGQFNASLIPGFDDLTYPPDPSFDPGEHWPQYSRMEEGMNGEYWFIESEFNDKILAELERDGWICVEDAHLVHAACYGEPLKKSEMAEVPNAADK